MTHTNINEIVRTKRLTRQLLLEEVLPEHNESIYFKNKGEEILADLGRISSMYDLDERLIIYCFIRLEREGKVNRLNFFEAYEKNKYKTILAYHKMYYYNLSKQQEALW